MATIGVQAMMLKDAFAQEGAFETLRKVSSIGYHAVEISQISMTAENVAELEAYINEIAGWVTKKQLRNQTSRLQYMNRRPLSA